jgi:hypothetical protein
MVAEGGLFGRLVGHVELRAGNRLGQLGYPVGGVAVRVDVVQAEPVEAELADCVLGGGEMLGVSSGVVSIANVTPPFLSTEFRPGVRGR